ncbi:MAG: hypothetical protein ACOC1D_01460 [Prolixibacteraceae bacterium]
MTGYTLIITLLLGTIAVTLNAQHNNNLLLLKNRNSQKTKIVAHHSKFKAKTLGKKKFKGRITKISDSFLVSDVNDTIYFNDICWIKAKKQLTKWEQRAGIAGMFVSALYTPVSLLAVTMISMMEGTKPVVFLIPVTPIGIGIISIRTLGGRRYKMKKWELYSISSNNLKTQH